MAKPGGPESFYTEDLLVLFQRAMGKPASLDTKRMQCYCLCSNESILSSPRKKNAEGGNIMMMTLPLRSDRTALIDHTIALWIKTKTETSESSRTRESYERAIAAFRDMALTAGIDLDGFPSKDPVQHRTGDEMEHALAALGLIAQAWASSAHKEKQLQEGISANTYNNRLTIISSFYTFGKERRLLRMDNPIEQIERRKIQDYISARPLFNDQIAAALEKINKQTLAGKRDYALLLLLLGTGRRASEVRTLVW